MPLGGNIKGGQAKPDQLERSGRRQGATKRSVVKAIHKVDYITELFDGLFMLTIKDNSNEISSAHLIYLMKYCAKFLKSDYQFHVLETGKQGKIHIHAVLKSKKNELPNHTALMKYLQKYELFYQEETETDKGHIINRERIDISSMTFHISPIRDNAHLKTVKDDYFQKEKRSTYEGVDFID